MRLAIRWVNGTVLSFQFAYSSAAILCAILEFHKFENMNFAHDMKLPLSVSW